MPLSLYRDHKKESLVNGEWVPGCRSKDSQNCTDKTNPCPIAVRGTLPQGMVINGKHYYRGSLRNLLGKHVGIVRDWRRAQGLIAEFEKSGGKRPELISSKNMHIETLRDQFIANKRATNRRGGTLRKYDFLFRQLLAFTRKQGIRFVEELTPAKVEEFRNTWTDGALSRQKRDQRLRSVFKYAINHDMLVVSPMRGIETIKVDENDSVRDFSEDEMRAILIAARADHDKRILPLVLLMRYGGLAIADATMLNASVIKGRQLEISRVKTRKKVSVKLPQFVVDAIRGIKNREYDGYFWWNGKSKLESLTDLYRDQHLRRVFEAAKVEGTPHMFRHTFVHALLNQGWSMRDVATAIGDKPSTVEKYYSKWNAREQEAQNKRMDAANEADPLLKELSTGDLLKAKVVMIKPKKQRAS